MSTRTSGLVLRETTNVPIPLPTAARLPRGHRPRWEFVDPANLIQLQPDHHQRGQRHECFTSRLAITCLRCPSVESTGRFRVIFAGRWCSRATKESDHRFGHGDSSPVSTLSSVVGNTGTVGNFGQQSNLNSRRLRVQLEVVPLLFREGSVRSIFPEDRQSRGEHGDRWKFDSKHRDTVYSHHGIGS